MRCKPLSGKGKAVLFTDLSTENGDKSDTDGGSRQGIQARGTSGKAGYRYPAAMVPLRCDKVCRMAVRSGECGCVRSRRRMCRVTRRCRWRGRGRGRYRRVRRRKRLWMWRSGCVGEAVVAGGSGTGTVWRTGERGTDLSTENGDKCRAGWGEADRGRQFFGSGRLRSLRRCASR